MVVAVVETLETLLRDLGDTTTNKSRFALADSEIEKLDEIDGTYMTG